MTSCGANQNKTDEDLTEEALLRQYDELMMKGEVKKETKKKGKKPIYDNMADELIDELDQHEKEMNDMLKYLQETQDFLRSKEDIESIEQMMVVTKDTMDQHFEAYNKFKGQIDTLNQQADQAIMALNFYNNDDQTADGAKSDTQSVASTRKIGSAGIRGVQGIKNQTTLERVGEQESDESSQSEQESESSSSGSDEDSYARKINKPLKKKVSQEEKKGGIVKTLLGMNT